ncbi:hypothetical protein [Liberiplasma polymorphum]|uniref:hypothetical protein n=1 Tax=Liberiplasma polymorphum TaxID=3374570 RepID=UPI003772A05B
MKKLLVLFTLMFVITLSGCQNKLEKAFNTMEEVESYRMDMTISNVPLFGTLTFTFKVDGDLSYTSNPLGGEGTYTKTVDGEEYDYILQTNGTYVLSDTPNETNDELNSILLDDLNYDDFEETSKGVWELTKERIYLNDEETEYMKDVVIILNADGYIDTITFSMVSDGMNVDVEIDISGYNNTTVQLPE